MSRRCCPRFSRLKSDLSTREADLVATLAPADSAGVTAIINVRMTGDGKSYAYSFDRELSDLFLVEGVR
jgi:hypothetical protein